MPVGGKVTPHMNACAMACAQYTGRSETRPVRWIIVCSICSVVHTKYTHLHCQSEIKKNVHILYFNQKSFACTKCLCYRMIITIIDWKLLLWNYLMNVPQQVKVNVARETTTKLQKGKYSIIFGNFLTLFFLDTKFTKSYIELFKDNC